MTIEAALRRLLTVAAKDRHILAEMVRGKQAIAELTAGDLVVVGNEFSAILRELRKAEKEAAPGPTEGEIVPPGAF